MYEEIYFLVMFMLGKGCKGGNKKLGECVVRNRRCCGCFVFATLYIVEHIKV